jgi:hypothetical protein
MAIDPLTVTLISAIFAGIGAIILKLHIKKCNTGCINSDCTRSRHNSIVEEEPTPEPIPEPTVKITDV